MSENGRVVAVGFFDGVHIGHGELLKRAKQKAQELDAKPAVLSFDTHPDDLVFKQSVRLIGDRESREDLIHRCFNIPEVFFLHFDRDLMNMSWEQFISFSVEKYNICCYVVGYDFTFGKNGEGTARKLQEYCRDHGLGCEIIDAVKLEGQIVSSTLIRTMIENGDMEKANRFLGHPYCISGTVQPGFQRGRKMQAPTVNLAFSQGVVIPRYGVYAAKAVLPDSSEWMAATNVGIRPTFQPNSEVSVESFLLHFNGDLYGKRVRIDFYSFLRPEVKFRDVHQLTLQIQKDAAEAEAFLLNTDNRR